jgi:hypothetical protein
MSDTQTVETTIANDEQVTQEATALARQPIEPGSILSIIKDAVVNRADVAVMRELLAIRREERADQAREAFANALVIFRKLVKPILMTGHRDDRTRPKRDGSLGSVHYDYAELTTTIEQITPALDQCGLTPTWRTVQSDATTVGIECVVTHVLGYRESSGPLSSPVEGSSGQTAVQKRMGTITSLKRATLFMALGLTTKEDDRSLKDAEQGEDKEVPQPPAPLTKPDPKEDEAKRRFRDIVLRKLKAESVGRGLLKSVYEQVKAASGKGSVAECADWLASDDVLVSQGGVLSVVTDSVFGDPFADPQTPAAAKPTDLQGGADHASTKPQPPSYHCNKCGEGYLVRTANGICQVTAGCTGKVVEV